MNVFDLYAKIALDSSEYDKKLDDSKAKGSQFADVMKKGFSAVGKAAAAGLGAAVTGVTALTKAAVENYAEYEQLVGGVETLFGAGGRSLAEYADNTGKTISAATNEYQRLMDAQQDVMDNAANAYKTAGMSANEYMSTVTSISAALIQGLDGDTVAAAEKADMAITDMADNANKMGTSVEMIQNAYQGFAKQNYTMLDNLKLGYGGTQAEMYRLMQDAAKLNEDFAASTEFELTSKGTLIADYNDIIDAIHIVQTEMGITGTTAKEASQTISGSVSSMKAAWQNLLTGVADDQADFGGLVENFVDTVGTVAENILPRVEIALNGAGKLVETLIPVIIEQIPPLIENVLPQLITAGINIIRALMDGVIENQDQLIDLIMEVILMLIDGIADMAPDLIVAGITIILKLIEGLVEAYPEIIAKVPEIISRLVSAFKDAWPTIKGIGKNIVEGIWDGIKSMGKWLADKVDDFVDGLIGGVKDLLGIHSPSRVFAGIGKFMAEGLGEGFSDEMISVRRDISAAIPTASAEIGITAGSGIGGGVTVVQNIYSKAQTAASLMREARWEQERAVMMGV